MGQLIDFSTKQVVSDDEVRRPSESDNVHDNLMECISETRAYVRYHKVMQNYASIIEDELQFILKYRESLTKEEYDQHMNYVSQKVATLIDLDSSDHRATISAIFGKSSEADYISDPELKMAVLTTSY